MNTKVMLSAHDDPAHPERLVVDIEIPAGYYRVWRGALKPGDMHLSCDAIKEGIVKWVPLLKMPTVAEVRRREVYSAAHWFACIIRPGEGPVDQPCERCECEARLTGRRFCLTCCGIVVRQQRAAAKHLTPQPPAPATPPPPA